MATTRQNGNSPTAKNSSVIPCAPYSDSYHVLSQKTPNGVNRAQTNINFLDRPLFIPARKLIDPATGEATSTENMTRYSDGNGFEIQSLIDTEKQLNGLKATHGLPTYFDKKVLCLLGAYLPIFDEELAIAKRELYADTDNLLNSVEITNIRGFLREINAPNNGQTLNRLKESLAKWTEILLIYRKNSFTTSKSADGDQLTTIISNQSLKVMDSVQYVEDAKGKVSSIKVSFNKDFILCNNEKFTRRLDLKVFFSFKSPTAARLYEILSKTFWGKSGRTTCTRTGAIQWKINLENLLAKLGTHRVRNASKMVADAIFEVNQRSGGSMIRYAFKEGSNKQIVVEFTRFSGKGKH
jgi:hypothetical protein